MICEKRLFRETRTCHFSTTDTFVDVVSVLLGLRQELSAEEYLRSIMPLVKLAVHKSDRNDELSIAAQQKR